jgi:hypothetical protein
LASPSLGDTAVVHALNVIVTAYAAAAAGQKKLIPSFDDIKQKGDFIIELFGIGPAVEEAKKVVQKGEDLRAPIPSTVTRQFSVMGKVMDNVSPQTQLHCYVARIP